MKHRIRGVALIVRDGRILLAAHEHRILKKTFWEPPGGGWEISDASILETAKREAFEEAGVVVTPSRIVYLSECVDHTISIQYLEVFVLMDAVIGEASLKNLEPQHESVPVHIVDVRWFTREELQLLTVHPIALKDRFWVHLEAGFPSVVHLGRTDLRATS